MVLTSDHSPLGKGDVLRLALAQSEKALCEDRENPLLAGRGDTVDQSESQSSKSVTHQDSHVRPEFRMDGLLSPPRFGPVHDIVMDERGRVKQLDGSTDMGIIAGPEAEREKVGAMMAGSSLKE